MGADTPRPRERPEAAGEPTPASGAKRAESGRVVGRYDADSGNQDRVEFAHYLPPLRGGGRAERHNRSKAEAACRPTAGSPWSSS